MWSFKDIAEGFNKLDKTYRRLVFATLLCIISVGILLVGIDIAKGHHGRISQWEYNLPDTVFVYRTDTVIKTLPQKEFIGDKSYNTEVKGPVDRLHIGDNN